MKLAAHVLALAVMFTAAPKPAEAHHGHGCKTRRCHKRVETKRADRECSQRNPRACVRYVVLKKRITGWKRAWMFRIPGCESTWNPYATNGPHVGLYQFRVAAPSTWATTPYGRRDPFSARWQAHAAAWMLKVGRAPGEWACK